MCNENNRTMGDVLDYLRTSYDCTVINGTKPNFPGIYVCETDRILWYKNLKHTTTENYESDGKDTVDLMMIIRWVKKISSRQPALERASLTHTTPHIAKKITTINVRSNDILDTLSTEYNQQAYTRVSRFFDIMCSMQISNLAWWW